MREIATRYGRSPGGYVWALLEPMAFIGLMSVLMSTVGRAPAMGDSFALFYASGFLAFNMYKGMESYLSSAVSANRSLLSYPNVAPIDSVIARFVLQGLTSLVVAAVILGGAMLTVHHKLHIYWAYLFEAVGFAWCLALGVALANIVLFFRFPIYETLFGILMRPLFLLSGVFYIPMQMPHPFSDYLLANPISHVVILFREGFYGESLLGGADTWFLGETSLIVLFIGLLLFTFFPVARER